MGDRERFTTKQHKDYIELFDNGIRVCSCDNSREVEEEKRNRRGY